MKDNTQQEVDKILNIPNFLSFLRVLIAPVILYYMSVEDSALMLTILIVSAIITDFADGMTARAMNQITRAGKFLDPLADKIIVGFVMLGVTVYRDFPLWALLIILSRDVIILLAALLIVRKKDVVPVSNMMGKVTVNIYAFTFIAYIFQWDAVKTYLLYLSLAFVVMSLISYYRSNYKILKN